MRVLNSEILFQTASPTARIKMLKFDLHLLLMILDSKRNALIME